MAETNYPIVIPAKAGIHLDDRRDGAMDPGFRRDDDGVLAVRRAG
jgi:hypothetical protein